MCMVTIVLVFYYSRRKYWINRPIQLPLLRDGHGFFVSFGAIHERLSGIRTNMLDAYYRNGQDVPCAVLMIKTMAPHIGIPLIREKNGALRPYNKFKH